MSEALARWAELVARRPWTVLVASLAVSLVMAAGALRLQVDLSPEKQLPADHPYVTVDRRIREEFGGKNFVAIAVVPQSGNVWRKDVLDAVHAITLALLDAPGVIRQNVVSLSSPYVRVPADRGGTLVVEYLMREVPADAAAIAALRARTLGEPLLRGTVVSGDERAALVLADFYDDVGPADIAASVERAIAPWRSPGRAIAITGAPILQNTESILIRQQGIFFAGTVAAILIVLFLAFGQLQGVVLPTLTALLATAWATGFMGHAGIPLSSWTASVPLMVVTVAAGHSAQMLKRFYEEHRRLGDRTRALVESTRRIGVVMLAAGATAGSGFAALSLVGVPTLMHFGLGVACGIVAAVLLEMSFMLALRALWPIGRDSRGEGALSRALGAVLRPLDRVAERSPRAVVAAFALVALAAVAGLPRLTTDIDAGSYWSADSPVGRDLRVFRQHFPSTTSLTVLLEGPPGSMKSPEAIGLMTRLQEAMASDPEVGRTSSLADVIRRTYEVFVPEDAGRALPLRSDLIAQLFFLSESPAFERYVDRSYSRSVVTGFLDREDSGLTRRVIARLEPVASRPPAGIRVFLAGGVGPTLLALNEHTVHGKVLNVAILLAVIFAIAGVLLRSVVGGAYVAAPLAMALTVDLGLFSWLGVPFDLGGASIAAIGVGIGADYAIYFLYRLREEVEHTPDVDEALRAAVDTSGRAVLFVALAISAGFAVYLFSGFSAFRRVGFFVPVTMFVCSATALMLLPALVRWFRPRFVTHRPRLPEPERLLGAGGSR